jgi:hypothetical protein
MSVNEHCVKLAGLLHSKPMIAQELARISMKTQPDPGGMKGTTFRLDGGGGGFPGAVDSEQRMALATLCYNARYNVTIPPFCCHNSGVPLSQTVILSQHELGNEEGGTL